MTGVDICGIYESPPLPVNEVYEQPHTGMFECYDQVLFPFLYEVLPIHVHYFVLLECYVHKPNLIRAMCNFGGHKWYHLLLWEQTINEICLNLFRIYIQVKSLLADTLFTCIYEYTINEYCTKCVS